jgi:hypothetical protein
MKFDYIKNILFSSILSFEFYSISNKFIYKILSLPNKYSNNLNHIDINNTNTYNTYNTYNTKSKYLSKDSLCIPKDINLENYLNLNLNSQNNFNLEENKFIYSNKGSNILNLIKSFSEEGRNNTNNNNNYNNYNNSDNEKLINNDINSNKTINFFLKIFKKSNLILEVKIFPLTYKKISINKITLYDNFNIFEKSENIKINLNDLKENYKNNNNIKYKKIIFQKNNIENNLINNFFELKLLEMNIVGYNFIYEIEYNYINENENKNKNKSESESDLSNLILHENSCNLIEDYTIDENFKLFFNEFNSIEIINTSIKPFNFFFELIMIYASVLLLFLILLIICYLNKKKFFKSKRDFIENMNMNTNTNGNLNENPNGNGNDINRNRYKTLEMSKNINSSNENEMQKI